MYYIDIKTLLKEERDWISSTQLFLKYQEKYGESTRLNFNKALKKLRRRDDIEWRVEGRTYFYKFNFNTE